MLKGVVDDTEIYEIVAHHDGKRFIVFYVSIYDRKIDGTKSSRPFLLDSLKTGRASSFIAAETKCSIFCWRKEVSLNLSSSQAKTAQVGFHYD